VTTTLRIVLGDQLTRGIASLSDLDTHHDVVLMAEVAAETRYVKHHKKKIAFVLAAMRAFARELREAGVQVRYVRLDDPDNSGSIVGEIARAVTALRPESMVVTEPGEHRLMAELRESAAFRAGRMQIREDERFLCSHQMFRKWANGRSTLRMEYFYREMRRHTGILMDGDQPVGGRWNYDAENRKRASPDLFAPKPPRFEPEAETRAVLDLVRCQCSDHFGDLEPFWFAVTRGQAEQAAAHFMKHALPHFGDFQDAMLQGEPFLYHAVLSAYLNVGLLDPLQLCQQAEAAYRAGAAPLNAAEGFIRQILGWREYVRGIYWREGPDYMRRNALGASRPLPEFYWTGASRMACLQAAIGQTKQEAYAHHIQRLMVTGNFALLAGIDPHALHEWYLAVYADAYEWVEAPNTIGMSQYADGGLLASKPYASSGAYINKMSDYCAGCAYKVAEKAGAQACPFNYLYWNFMERHRALLGSNPRMAPMYRVLDRMCEARRQEIADDASRFLAALK
jgi:deoxyribodipyrimidine photolyase-related protein